MTFVAFIIWVLIVAGTGYMLWKLVFEGRFCKKTEQEPMAVKTEKPDTKITEEDKPEEFTSEVVEAQKEPPADEEKNMESPEVIEGEAEEVEPEKEKQEEEVEEPEKKK